MKSQKHLLSKLFISTLYLSAFTFGGGYVIITLMKKKFVDQYHWIDDEEMLDLIAIAQSSPGAIAVNGAIVVGYKLAGSVVYDMGRGIIREKTPISLLIMGGAFLANYMFQINAVYIILFCIALGCLQTWYQKRRTLS